MISGMKHRTKAAVQALALALCLGAAAPHAALAADFDGDRLADPTLFDHSRNVWQIKPSSAGYSTVPLDSGL